MRTDRSERGLRGSRLGGRGAFGGRETELELTTDGQRLIIEPVKQRRQRVRAAARKVMDAHDETFRKLAK